MRNSNNQYKKPDGPLIYLLVACFTFGMVSCKNGDADKVGEAAKIDTNLQNSQSKSQTSAFLGSGKVSYLALHIDTLRSIFLPPGGGGLNSKKLVFRFRNEGTATSNWVIDGFATGPSVNNYLDRPPVELYEFTSLNIDLSNQRTYLSDLEFTRTQFNTLSASAGNNTHLIFVPFRHTTGILQNCLSYKVVWGNAPGFTDPGQGLVPLDELNPSPPADPR